MRRLLHILTRAGDPLEQTVLDHQRELAECQVEVVDLTRDDEPDYTVLLEKVFEADSVQVW